MIATHLIAFIKNIFKNTKKNRTSKCKRCKEFHECTYYSYIDVNLCITCHSYVQQKWYQFIHENIFSYQPQSRKNDLKDLI